MSCAAHLAQSRTPPIQPTNLSAPAEPRPLDFDMRLLGRSGSREAGRGGINPWGLSGLG